MRNLIREDKIHQIYSAMQSGRSQSGMQTFNQSLYELVQRKQVRQEDALAHSSDPDELRKMMLESSPQRLAPR